ncbi:hypothetical protein RSOLAG22IIIB_00261 [Rhizoctonia solani]|uniref:F-box domain-containing protein n=1 Tax=Rhizoctonia solani TaxID=456999 RepID=A0A0K6FKW8_9AGAM|nr:hypothetical protein RSOLAG22IIIB_00261 [Rhizoctonia solani]
MAEQHNIKQRVNQLPPEILSQVFMNCGDEYWIPEYIDCQTIVTAVCRHWRKVALNTPTLWTEIVVFDSDKEPYNFAALCLARSGPMTPLDIKIELRSHFMPNSSRWEPSPKDLIQRVCSTYEFLSAHRATTSRWRSFHLETNVFGVLAHTIKLIQTSPMPRLQSIQLLFENDPRIPERVRDPGPPEPLFLNHTSSQLRIAKFIGVPSPYLFGNTPRPQLTDLTCLELEFLGAQPDFEQLGSMLSANPRICVLDLSVSSDLDYDSTLRPSSKYAPKIYLSSLRKLCMSYSPSTWVKDILGMIDAPSLKTFKLFTSDVNRREDPAELLSCFVHQVAGSEPTPRFPLLKHFSYEPDRLGLDVLELFLVAYPKLTTFGLELGPWLDVPLRTAQLLPNLTYLKVSEANRLDSLRQAITVWKDAGVPLVRVKVDVGLHWDFLREAAEAELKAIRELVKLVVVDDSGKRH